MNKYIYTLLLIFAASPYGRAQQVSDLPVTNNAYETALVNQQWFRSTNISGFGTDSVLRLSVVELGYHSQKGYLHRVQEAGEANAARFAARKIMPIGKYYLYGNFDFEQSRSFNKSWSDAIDPYQTGAMLFGSAIKAPYDWQSFGFNVKLGSRKQSRFMHGVSVDYRVGELSRQKDPRSLTEFADYSLSPGVSYLLWERTRVGLNLLYRFRKESMGNIKSIQEDPMIPYYLFTGLENYRVVVGKSAYGSFSRYFKDNYWGGDIQVQQITGNRSKLLVSGGFIRMNQSIEGGSVRENPGNLNQHNFRAGADLVLNANKGIHFIRLEGNYTNSGLDENIQEYSSNNDTETGIETKKWTTLYTHKNRFVSKALNGSINYAYHSLYPDNTSEYRWMLGASAEYTSFDKEYRLPYSAIGAARLNSHIKGAYQVDMKNKRNIHFLVDLGYAPSMDTKMEDLKDNIYTKEVLNQDFEHFYKKDFVHAQLDIRYEHPLVIKKMPVNLYVKAYIKNSASLQTDRRQLTSFGISLGMLTR